MQIFQSLNLRLKMFFHLQRCVGSVWNINKLKGYNVLNYGDEIS